MGKVGVFSTDIQRRSTIMTRFVGKLEFCVFFVCLVGKLRKTFLYDHQCQHIFSYTKLNCNEKLCIFHCSAFSYIFNNNNIIDFCFCCLVFYVLSKYKSVMIIVFILFYFVPLLLLLLTTVCHRSRRSLIGADKCFLCSLFSTVFK